jgi:hypothetical protein
MRAPAAAARGMARAAQHLEHDRENLNLVPPTGCGRPEK